MKTINFVKSTGTIVEIQHKSGGWTTCLTADGRMIKVRNGDVGTKSFQEPAAPVEAPAPVVTLEQAMAENFDAALVDELTADETKAIKGKSVIAKEYRKSYVVDKDNRNASGRETISNGDFVAQILTGLTLEQVYTVARACGIHNDYNHLNTGMQRMNLGNRIRKVLNDGLVDANDVAETVYRVTGQSVKG